MQQCGFNAQKKNNYDKIKFQQHKVLILEESKTNVLPLTLIYLCFPVCWLQNIPHFCVTVLQMCFKNMPGSLKKITLKQWTIMDVDNVKKRKQDSKHHEEIKRHKYKKPENKKVNNRNNNLK